MQIYFMPHKNDHRYLDFLNVDKKIAVKIRTSRKVNVIGVCSP